MEIKCTISISISAMISFIHQRPCLLTFGLSFHIINHQWGKRYIIICDIRWQYTLCVCECEFGGVKHAVDQTPN